MNPRLDDSSGHASGRSADDSTNATLTGGMTAVLNGTTHPSDALIPTHELLGQLPFEDREQLNGHVPSAHIELLISELMERAEVCIVAAPDADQALLRRLSLAVEGIIPIIDPRDKHGSRFAHQPSQARPPSTGCSASSSTP